MRNTLDSFVSITKALSDSSRVRILMALRIGELCVCQIIELLGLAPSTVSKHMSILKQAGLVKSRKKARWIYYRLADDDEQTAIIRGIYAWIVDELHNDETIGKDSRNLKIIMKKNPSSLCTLQRRK